MSWRGCWGRKRGNRNHDMWMKWCWKKYVRKNPLGKTAFYFIDSKDMYFRKTDTNNKHTSFRTHKEAQELFFSKIEAHGDFVLASVIV